MYWMKRTRTFTLVLISVLFLGLVVHLATAPSANAKLRLTFGTSPMGGTWYPMAAGLAELWNKEIPEITVTVEGSGGGSANVKWMASGKLDVAMCSGDMIHLARDGKKPYNKKYDLKDLGSVIILHASEGHWVTLKKGPIKGLRDLKGKRIAIGDRGTAGNMRAIWMVEAAGLKESDVKVEYIGDQQSADALKDGRIDAYFEPVGAPNSTILNLSITTPLRFLEMTKEEERRLTKKYPFMVLDIVPAGTYKDSPEWRGFGVPGNIEARTEIPADVVYKMCKAIDENWEYLYKVHKKFRRWKFHPNIETITGQPLHPGAKRFYKEKGIIK